MTHPRPRFLGPSGVAREREAARRAAGGMCSPKMQVPVPGDVSVAEHFDLVAIKRAYGPLVLQKPPADLRRGARIGGWALLGLALWMGAAYLFGHWVGSGGTAEWVRLDCQPRGTSMLLCYRNAPVAPAIEGELIFRARRVE